MTENNDDFFTSKHKRLERISTTANIFSWLILVFFILQALSQYLNLTSQQSFQVTLEMFKQYPESAADFFLGIINVLLKGAMYWIILKGVSLGLNMIVDTNLNQRETFQVEEVDKTPVSYQPKEVIRINDWLNRLAIAAIGITVLASIPEILKMHQIILSYFYGDTSMNLIAWLITIIISGLVLALQCFIYYYSLKALAFILKILMDMEFSSRAIK